MIRKITVGLILSSASFLVIAEPLSNQELMQKFSTEKFKCMSFQKSSLRGKCLSELRTNLSLVLSKRQRKVGEAISGRASYKSAVQKREEIYEDSKHKTPRW